MAMAMQEIMLLMFTGSYPERARLSARVFTDLGVKVFYQQLLTFACPFNPRPRSGPAH